MTRFSNSAQDEQEAQGAEDEHEQPAPALSQGVGEVGGQGEQGAHAQVQGSASPVGGGLGAAPPTPVFTPAGSSEGQEPDIVNGRLVLQRRPNFIVQTSNRQGQRPHPLRQHTGNTTLLPVVAPQQARRIAGRDTRAMPRIMSFNEPRKPARYFPRWLEMSLVGLMLLVYFVAHAYNLFYLPHYELDEGTYVSSAWAILHGMIEPYPYGYGHPPLGWMQIAAWFQLTGGYFTFGNALNSGRVFMLFYGMGSALLVYLIARRLTDNALTALLTMGMFSLTPLGIVYQRQVFLDNIGTFWLLLSLCLLVFSKSRLSLLVFAGISLGIAILSKEIFVLFIPVMIYGVWLHTTHFQRKFSLLAFVYAVIALGSSFVLLAILKGELFPVGFLPWDNHQHLSLLGTYLAQTQRGQSQGSFSASWTVWTQDDPVLMYLSILAPLFNVVMGWWNRKWLFMGLLSLCFWLLLIRGGVVYPFYLIPMIPLVAINVAVAMHIITGWLSKAVHLEVVRVALLGLALLAIGGNNITYTLSFINQRPAQAQTDALLWVRNNVPRNAVLVISSYFYVDMREQGGEGVGNGPTFPFANIYWNVAYDPELHDRLLKNDWNRIDYIITDSYMLYDINTNQGPMTIISQALEHSVMRAQFQAQDREQRFTVQIFQVIHPQTVSITDHASPGGLSIAWRKRVAAVT